MSPLGHDLGYGVMRYLLFTFITLLTASLSLGAPVEKPNFIVIFTDDQGYQDLGCFGSPKIKTPEIDQMAKEGARFSSFYSANAICSASRAALLTGRYPSRNGVYHVFYPGAQNGLPPEEVTIAEALQPAGYRTAIIGKWHLGDRPQFLPTNQGFDSFFGIPYSNDMWIHKDQEFADDAKLFDGATIENVKSGEAGKAKDKSGKVPLMRDNKIIEYPVDQTHITQRYTDEAIKVIDEAKQNDQPFFIYLAHAMPHVPLYASEQFSGKSERGPYGDTIEEMDFHTGRLLDHLKKSGADKDTLVIFTSDNGPWKLSRDRGGSALPFRGAKFSTYEGGHRVPCVMWWPGTIPAGTESAEIVTTLDFLPTLTSLAGTNLPKDRIIDGKDITNLLKKGSKEKSEYDRFFYWSNQHIEAYREGHYKFRLAWDKKTKSRKEPELFDLSKDLSESHNLAASMADKVREMSKVLLEEERSQIIQKSFEVKTTSESEGAVQASGHFKEYQPANAFDRDDQTKWTADGAKFPQWIQTSYDSVQTTDQLQLLWGKSGVFRYLVGTSMDGTHWTVQVDQLDNNETRETSLHKIPQTEFKHLRVVVLGAMDGRWASFREIRH
ncbi:MAG: sulfatase-like hydrolase/transferase [Verrucomicrobiota bacterium]